MSIFASLLSAEPSPSTEAIAGLRAHASDLLSIAVVPMPEQHFITEDYGLEPHVLVQFTLNKEHSSQARTQLALAVREFLAASERDVLVMYLDTPIVRCVGDARQVAPGYEQFAPEDAGWLVSSIEASGASV